MKSGLLLFHAGWEEQAALDWARVSRGGKVKTGRAAPGERLPRAGEDEPTVLLVAGEEVCVHVVDMPARTHEQVRVAACFAVEDLTAQPLEDAWVAPGAAPAPGRRAIAVVDKAAFAAWRQRLEAYDATAERIVPDYLALPVEEGEAIVVDLGERVLVRAGATGFAAEQETAMLVAGPFLERAAVGSVRLLSNRPDVILPHLARRAPDVRVEPAVSGADLARLFFEGLSNGAALDLSAADARSSGGVLLLWRAWRAAAALLVAAAVSFTALMAAQTASFNRAGEANVAEVERLLLETFPDMGRIVNPRAQLRARAAAAGADGAAFIALSGLVADSVRDIDTVEVESVRFDAARSQLDVAVRHASYEDVERLAAAVDARGGVLEEGGSRRMGDAMVSDVVVRADG